MFDINQPINDMIESGELDPLAIAAKVADQVPDSELRPLVALLLGQRVRERIRAERGVLFSRAPETTPSPIPVGASSPKRTKQPYRPGVRRQQAETWKERLRAKVEAAGHGYMLLGECTMDDLKRLELSFATRAEANRAQADFYARGAALLKTSKKTHLRDVPQLALRRYLESAA